MYVRTGKDKGKTAKVLRVVPKENRLIAEGVNVYKKHVRPKREGEKGEVVEVTRSLSAANVMLVCSSCGKRTRISRGGEEAGRKRVCKKCKAAV